MEELIKNGLVTCSCLKPGSSRLSATHLLEDETDRETGLSTHCSISLDKQSFKTVIDILFFSHATFWNADKPKEELDGGLHAVLLRC